MHRHKRTTHHPPPDQVRLLSPGHPYAFFFETLEESRHYAISLDGVDNADARTGAFTTLKVGRYVCRSIMAIVVVRRYRLHIGRCIGRCKLESGNAVADDKLFEAIGSSLPRRHHDVRSYNSSYTDRPPTYEAKTRKSS